MKAVLRIERCGRGGKTVTIVEKLPRINKFLDELSRKLKTGCGAGGKYELTPDGGRIEIQGDNREKIRNLLLKEGIESKG